MAAPASARALASLLLALLAVGSARAEGPSAFAELLAGETYTDLEGESWTAEDLAGRVVLVDFWATWCTPCIAQMPKLKELDARYDRADLVIVGVALDSLDRRRLRSFTKRHRLGWPQIHEPLGTESEIARRFAVEAVPATFLIDRSGRVVARDLSAEVLAGVIETLVELGGHAAGS
ncbi:MAG: TlpA disulfide reductase family protein [Acidobacteriota bacterium]